MVDSAKAAAITGPTNIDLNYNSGLGSTFKTFNPASDGYNLVAAFAGASSSDRCPVTKVELYYMFNGGLVPWVDTTYVKI